MYPILFRIGSFEVRTYGVMVVLAIATAWFVARRRAKERGYNSDIAEGILTYGIIPGLVGARLFHVLFGNPTYYVENPLQVLAIWHGGLSIHGAIVGGVLGAIWFCRRNKVDFWRLADTFAPALILGQAVGRLACFFSGDAYGKPTNLPWAITFNDPLSLAPQGVPLHPTQLYEAGWDLIVFLILWKLRSRVKLNGGLFLLYAGLYSLGRFVIEIFRADVLTYRVLGQTISAAQALSLVIILAALVSYFVLGYRRREVSSLRDTTLT